MLKKLLVPLLFLAAPLLAIEPPPYYDMENRPLSDIECAAVNLYHESRSESDYANIYIMAVVFNREDSLRFPDSICDVVFQKSQFSWTSDGLSDEIKDLEQYDRLYRLVVRAIINRVFIQSMSEGVDHYHTKAISPLWSRSDQMRYIGSVDNHLFYSSKR